MHNGERFLAESIDSLLAQTFADFELLLSDNASTDRTPQICQEYAARDARVRYVRREVNTGAAANHNTVVGLARGRYFKWASDDDLCAPTLLERCICLLEDDAEAVLAQSREVAVDESGRRSPAECTSVTVTHSHPWQRLRDLLEGPGGDDIYGVVRTSALRRIAPHGSYIHADRAVVASLCLQGRFVQAPEVLFFRREHSDRASRAPGWRARAAILDPARASHWRHPVVRVHLECAIGYVSAVTRADLGVTDSLRCFAVLGDLALRRVGLSHRPALRAPRVRSRRHGRVWGSSRRRTTRTVE